MNRTIPGSTLPIHPLVLGTNVFGWTADEAASFAVLDAFVAAGGTMIDTADSYSFWAPGNEGGESEAIIGRWLAARGRRDDVLIASKVSQHPTFTGLAPATIRGGLQESLRRLGVERIDLYYAHFDDAATPLEDTVATFSALVDEGLIGAIGVSNYTPERVRQWLEVTAGGGYHRPATLEPMYSLMERGIETDLMSLAVDEGIGVIPYYALARGFLTGKYRSGAADVDSPRAQIAAEYLTDRGNRVLAALEEIASARGVALASVALAWVLARPSIIATLASARNVEQLPALIAGAELVLDSDEVERLTRASE